MESVTVSTEVLYVPRKRVHRLKSGYEVDFWWEVRKRWLVIGVLCSVLAAVVWPRAGAAGGNYCMLTRPLHSEYLRYIPMSYIYYSAGRRSVSGAQTSSGCPVGTVKAKQACLLPPINVGGRVLSLAILHAHVLAPALCVATVEAFRGSGVDHRIVNGAVLSSAGAGCGWVSLGLCAPTSPSTTTPAAAPAVLVAVNYVTSILATPLLMLILCGRATIPPLGGIIATILISTTPFALGAFRQHNNLTIDNVTTTTANNTVRQRTTQLCALMLVYVDCCDLLREAEGSLYVGDVLVTLILVLCWLASSAAACSLYGRCGLVARGEARLVAATAIPKCLEPGWQSSTACTGSGLSRLPAVFAAPAQALLLAALTVDDDISN